MAQSEYFSVRLKKNEEKRIKSGHLWVYSNEIDVKHSNLKEVAPGTLCSLIDDQGKPMGVGYINPHSLISVRLLSRNAKTAISPKFFEARLQNALGLREMAYAMPYYRWIYGESDGLPGLVVDRFGDYIVVQLNTAGMEAMKEMVVDAIVSIAQPAGVLLKCDSSARQPEGLPSYVEVAHGQWPDENLLLEENETQFMVPAQLGQKTGWFFDHRDNRKQLQQLVAGKRVLDVFSYVGGWGIQAAVAGASELMCVDTSDLALEYVLRNAELNSVADQVTGLKGSAFEVMEALLEDQEKFDVVILDPPAFIKRKKDIKNGTNAYRHGNELAARLLNKGGVLVSASCSMHLAQENLLSIVRQTGRHIDRHVQVFHHGSQGMDHPVHPAIPETQYLKALFSRVHDSL